MGPNPSDSVYRSIFATIASMNHFRLCAVMGAAAMIWSSGSVAVLVIAPI